MNTDIICGIYKITSPSGRIYIGESKDIKRRFKNYKALSCKSQHRLYNSFIKYGFNEHISEIIEECNFDELLCRERYWQDFYDVLNGGLNLKLTECGEKKVVHSEETRKRISEGREKQKVYQFDFEGVLIKEWECLNQILQKYPTGKGSIWKCLKNKQQTAFKFIWSYKNEFEYKQFNSSLIVYQFNLIDGKPIKKWHSASEASTLLGIQVSSILLCCKNKRGKAGNFRWSHTKELNIFNSHRNASKKIAVLQLTKEGELIREWESISQAAKQLNLSTANISSCCKNKPSCKTAGGFIWRYKETN